MSFWLVKSDPETYSWFDLVRDGSTVWDGVRNYQARNNLRLMTAGDKVLVYHSNFEKSVFGIAEVNREFFQDPTTDDSNWVAVSLRYSESFNVPVSLQQMKSNEILQNIGLIKQSRLSVMPLTVEEYEEIVRLGNSKG